MLRNDVNKALELARTEKMLGSSLEGQASVADRDCAKVHCGNTRIRLCYA